VRRFLKVLIFTTFVGLLLAACGFTPTPHLPAVSSYDTPTPYTPFPGETPLSTLTPTSEEPAPADAAAPTAQSESCTPDSEYVADPTIPDGTLVKPGGSFVKTWRIQNDGTCTWNAEYTWEQLNTEDNALLAVQPVMHLAANVPPGETLDISVELKLQPDAPLGSQQIARFQMRSPSGEFFGTHPFTIIFAVNGSGVCPIGTSELLSYINLSDHYCFLYPKDHTTHVGQDGTHYVSKPAPSGSTEELFPTVGIYNKGSTGGLSLQDWAEQEIGAAEAPGSPTSTFSTHVGDKDAIASDDLPGITTTRVVYVVHSGTGFEIFVIPIDGIYGAETLDLWETIRDSFVFYAQ
jgi:hypothetical protein